MVFVVDRALELEKAAGPALAGCFSDSTSHRLVLFSFFLPDVSVSVNLLTDYTDVILLLFSKPTELFIIRQVF